MLRTCPLLLYLIEQLVRKNAMGCCHRETPVMTEDQKKILHEMEVLALTLDKTWITVCGRPIGADGIIGLVPVVGDLSTTGVSMWIVMRAWFAFDKWLFRRKWCVMLFNVGVDFCIGTIPIAGDIFDVFWKCNIKNVNLVRKHYGMEKLVVDPDEDEEEGDEEEGDEEAAETDKKKKRWGRK